LAASAAGAAIAAAGDAEEAAAVAADESEAEAEADSEEDAEAEAESSVAGAAGFWQAAIDRAARAAEAIRALRTMVMDPNPYILTLERLENGESVRNPMRKPYIRLFGLTEQALFSQNRDHF
jgi:predicted  nucleic acid-binding Zn-ribbon protein